MGKTKERNWKSWAWWANHDLINVRLVNGSWFAHLPDRVLGPFKFEWQAWRAGHLETEEKKRGEGSGEN